MFSLYVFDAEAEADADAEPTRALLNWSEFDARLLVARKDTHEKSSSSNDTSDTTLNGVETETEAEMEAVLLALIIAPTGETSVL